MALIGTPIPVAPKQTEKGKQWTVGRLWHQKSTNGTMPSRHYAKCESGMVSLYLLREKKDRHSTGLRLLLILYPGANTELSRLEQKQFKYNTKFIIQHVADYTKKILKHVIAHVALFPVFFYLSNHTSSVKHNNSMVHLYCQTLCSNYKSFAWHGNISTWAFPSTVKWNNSRIFSMMHFQSKQQKSNNKRKLHVYVYISIYIN